MIINGIILLVSLMMFGFIGVWIFIPSARSWFEAPKHRFMEANVGNRSDHYPVERPTSDESS